MSDQQDLPEHLDEWNEQMVTRHDPELFHDHPRRIVRDIEGLRVKHVLKLLQVKPDDVVLDIGCGAGNVLECIDAKELHGLDLSKSMVARAKKRLGTKAEIVLGDAEDLPFEDNRFDRVFCTSVLSHVYHPEAVFNEAYRVLKPGGRLVVSVSFEKNIEKGLRLSKLLFVDSLFLGGKHNSPHEDVYYSEYHLHHFDAATFLDSAKDLPAPVAFKKTPWFWSVHLIAAWVKP